MAIRDEQTNTYTQLGSVASGTVPTSQAVATETIPQGLMSSSSQAEERLRDCERRMEGIRDRISILETEMRNPDSSVYSRAMNEAQQYNQELHNLQQERVNLLRQIQQNTMNTQQSSRLSVSAMATNTQGLMQLSVEQMRNYQAIYSERIENYRVIPNPNFGMQISHHPIPPRPTPKPKPNPADDPKLLKKAATYPLVAKIEVDDQKRIIITTKRIYIKKEDWERKRFAGVYQIRIDFSKFCYNTTNAIDIVNTSKMFAGSPHPNIDGYICWGNMERDVEREFKDRDIIELVIDCVDFIACPYDENPNIDNGWEGFLAQAHKKDAKTFLPKPTDSKVQEDSEVPF